MKKLAMFTALLSFGVAAAAQQNSNGPVFFEPPAQQMPNQSFGDRGFQYPRQEMAPENYQVRVAQYLTQLGLASSVSDAAGALRQIFFSVTNGRLDAQQVANQVLAQFENPQSMPTQATSPRFQNYAAIFKAVADVYSAQACANRQGCVVFDPARVAAVHGRIAEHTATVLNQTEPRTLMHRTYSLREDGDPVAQGLRAQRTGEFRNMQISRGRIAGMAALEASRLSGRDAEIRPKVLAALKRHADFELRAISAAAVTELGNPNELRLDRALAYINYISAIATVSDLSPAAYVGPIQQVTREKMSRVLGLPSQPQQQPVEDAK